MSNDKATNEYTELRKLAEVATPKKASDLAKHWMGEHDVVLPERAYRALLKMLIRPAAPPSPQPVAESVRAWLDTLEDEALHDTGPQLFTKVRTYLQSHGYLAAALQPVAESVKPLAYVRADELVKLADPRIAGRGVMLHKDPGNELVPIYRTSAAALQPVARLTDADKQDAERYRWLRNMAEDMGGVAAPMVAMLDECGKFVDLLEGDELDAAIDAARHLTGQAGATGESK